MIFVKRFGILMDLHWCSGCMSCVVACQMEHGLPVGRSGIVITEIGPWQIEDTHWQHDFAASLTRECNLCAARTVEGKKPSCVQHCQAAVLSYGPVAELALQLNKESRYLLLIP